MAAANGYAYTGSLGVNQIASIQLAEDKVDVMPIAGPATRWCSSRFHRTARPSIGSTDVSGQLLVFSLAQPAKPAPVKSIDVGKMAFDPVYTPDGRFVWGIGQELERGGRDRRGQLERGRANYGEPFKQPHQVVFPRTARRHS